MAIELYNIDTDPVQVYQQYAPPPPESIPPPIVEGGSTIVTTINGAGGPNINFTSAIGFAFTGGTGGDVVMTVSNAALARSSIGAAASGINTDITQLNGASQVDVSGVYKVDGMQVVKEQQPAIADPSGGTTIDTEARAQLILLLNAARAHGLIAT